MNTDQIVALSKWAIKCGRAALSEMAFATEKDRTAADEALDALLRLEDAISEYERRTK